MRNTQIKKSFFKKLGIKKKYSLKEISCEICGNNNKIDILKKISLSQNELIEFPYSMCSNCGHLFQRLKFEKNFIKIII